MLLIDAKALDSERLRSLLAQGAEHFWLTVDSTDPAQHALLADVFHFHPLALEDTLNPHTRVKIEEYEGYFFIVLRAMRLDAERPLEPGRLDVRRLCLFLGPNYLVTAHPGPAPSIAEARERIQRDAGLVARWGAAAAAYVISDVVIDAYFPVLDEVDAYVERLEHTNLARGDHGTLEESLQVRRLAFAARRSLLPQRDIFDVLAHRTTPLLSREVQIYFRDVYDHVQRIADSLDAYRELIADTTDSNVARLSVRLGYTGTVLSAIATVVIPFLIVSSVYGMNFTNMPLTRDPNGFWIVLGAQIALSALLFAIFRWKRLL